MPNTTNFNWVTPADSDLVKDGAAAIRTLGNGIDTSFLDLKGGTSGQILSKNSNTDLDFVWIANDQGDITAVTAGTGISGGGTSGAVTITNDMATTITAAGDIVVGTGSGTYDNLPIGTTGQVLTADTTVSPYKVKWAAAASVTFVGCALVKNATQSINNGTETALTFASETYDTDGFHDNSTNNSRITIPSGKDGKYLFTGVYAFTDNATGIRYLNLKTNGTTNLYLNNANATVSSSGFYCFSFVLSLVATDYVEMFVYQSSGGALNATSDSRFQASYLGA